MIELEQALKIMHRTLMKVTTPVETISIRKAMGRILSRNISSPISLPPFDKSAMDGFAIHIAEKSDKLKIIETIQAGDIPTKKLSSGFCAGIMTGAPVPENTGRVIQVECTSQIDNIMTITRQSSAKNICRKGEDILKGEIIAETGTQLNALNLSVLISCGIEEIDVYCRPRVTVFSTGNELVETMKEWGPGKIFDSNGPMLIELMREAGADIIGFKHLPDDPDMTRNKLSQAIEISDIIAFSGGVSAGKFDFIPESLKRCGLRIHFSRLLVKPGKPMTYATGKNTSVFGFPGNPVSTWVMFHLFARPALNRLQGKIQQHRTISLPMAVDWKRKKCERLEFIPVMICEDKNSKVALTPLEYHGSAHLSALQLADGLALINPGTSTVSAGETVCFWPLTMKYDKGNI
ncbi:molybdopterin molybdotransferase MoeA [bacterium]|nr:molybdopterin molybdotransferase MoeA [bacterium]